MDVTLARVGLANLAILERVDPECFDEPIDMVRAARCVSSPDAILVVALAEGLVVGQCLAAIHRHPDKETELYIDDLAVAPAFRRQGIAKRLIEACVRYGRDAGTEALWVATEPANDEGNAFYRALGLDEEAVIVFDRPLASDPPSS